MSVAWALEADPKTFANQLVEASRDHPGWLETFTGELESQALGNQLRRVLDVWGLVGFGSRPPLWSIAPGAIKVAGPGVASRQDAGGGRPRRSHGPSGPLSEDGPGTSRSPAQSGAVGRAVAH